MLDTKTYNRKYRYLLTKTIVTKRRPTLGIIALIANESEVIKLTGQSADEIFIEEYRVESLPLENINRDVAIPTQVERINKKLVTKKVLIVGRNLFLLKKTIEIMNGARKIRVPEIIKAAMKNNTFGLFKPGFKNRIAKTPNEIK